MAAAHHPADAIEKKRSADHAGGCRCGGSKKRAAAAHHSTTHRRLRAAIGLIVSALRLTVAALVIVLPRLLQDLTTVPDGAAARIRRPHVRDRALRLPLPKDRAAHGIEEAAALALLLRA